MQICEAYYKNPHTKINSCFKILKTVLLFFFFLYSLSHYCNLVYLNVLADGNNQHLLDTFHRQHLDWETILPSTLCMHTFNIMLLQNTISLLFICLIQTTKTVKESDSDTIVMVIMLVAGVGGVFFLFALMALCYR